MKRRAVFIGAGAVVAVVAFVVVLILLIILMIGGAQQKLKTVSYTHLTLPTIYSV